MPAQEDAADMLAFQKWVNKWDKNYATHDEYNTGFKNFKENLLAVRDYKTPPAGLTLWDLVDDKADRPFKEHFGNIRLDRVLFDDNDESDDEDTFLILVPVKQDGSHKFVRQKDGRYKFVLQRRRRDAATVTHVPPVKRTSDDTKEEDIVKRQKIGCGGQNTRMLACCGD